MHQSDLFVLAGALVGGFFSGLTGFGTGLSAMPFWLVVVSPAVAAQLAAAGGVLGQLQTIRTIWWAVRWRNVGHVVLAGLVGVPIGTWLLPMIPARSFKLGVGVLLVVFCLYMLAARGRTLLSGRRPVWDIVVGLIGGVMAGVAGLSGPAPTVWATLHDWSRDEKRALFSCFNLAILASMLVSSAIAGLMTYAFWRSLAIMLPATILGVFIGHQLYRRIDTRGFDRIVLVMLAISGAVLIYSNV